jgi:hypothetical protein
LLLRAHAGKPRAGGGITLGLLIDEGILAPGENCLTVEYKSSMTYATLMPDGRISCHVRACFLSAQRQTAARTLSPLCMS